MQIAISLLVLSLVISTPALAQTSPVPPPMPAPGVAPAPGLLRAGNQYYEFSIGGMAKYMGVLRDEDPDSYNALITRFENLQSRHYGGKALMWGSIAAGAIMLIGSATFAQEEKTETDIFGEEEKVESTNNDLATTGGIIMVAGGLAGYLVMPGRGDYLDFINEHNRVKTDVPLQMSWQLLPTMHGAMVASIGLRYTLD